MAEKLGFAVIGDTDFTLGFRLAGVRKVFPCSRKDFPATLEKALADAGVGVLVISAEDYGMLPERVKDRVTSSLRPIAVIISKDESSAEPLRRLAKRAMGVDIWKSA
jgi:V/A-type H+-transporting ATPase subunit F